MSKHKEWRQTTLGEALPIRYGKARTDKAGTVREDSPVYGSSGIIDKFDRALTNGPALIIGRKGTVGAAHYSAEPSWPIDTVYFTEESEGKDLRFFKYLLDHLQLGRMDRSTAVPGLSRDDYNAKEIAVPDFDEQQRVVAEIEKQFTQLDAGVASLKQVQTALKRCRASVLKAACEGRLVSTEAELAGKENRSYQSAVQLLSKTEPPARPNRWNSRSKDVIPGHAALAVGNPQTTLPEGWAWSALVEIAKMESGHTPSREHPEWWDGTIPWIGIADAREYDSQLIHDTFQHTNPEGIKNSASRVLPSGTVCISRTASVGYVVVMAREMATSQDFVNWVPTTAVTADWLRTIFSADREVLRRFGKGSVHKTIYFPEWLSIHVAVPPLAEQRRIVAEVDRRLSLINELQAIIASNLLRSVSLRRSILQRAFCGN